MIPVLSYGSINDPTRPIYSTKSNVELTNGPVVHDRKRVLLQSIFISTIKKIAVINGDIFNEGDSVGDLMVTEINNNYVLVKYKTKVIKIMLSKEVYLDKVTGNVSE